MSSFDQYSDKFLSREFFDSKDKISKCNFSEDFSIKKEDFNQNFEDKHFLQSLDDHIN